jgi:inorganic pyrophosphatase/exopolyphosphatase
MFEKYLKSFKSSGFSRVVLGNTTADLDSTLGSILLAYLFTCNGTPSIPLVNQEKRLFLKQFDTLTLMKKYTKIEPGNLQFKEEVDLIDKELVLYDHNSVDREELSDLVVGVVDHHEDHGMNYKNLRFKEIVYSGSCISLVAQKLLKSQLMTTEMREMIELTLIHDTYNFGENMYIGLD